MPFDHKKVRPKDGWTLLLAEQRPSVLQSGLFIPYETHAEKITEFPGEVIRVGDGAFNDALRRQGLCEGKRVLYRGYLKYANPLETDEVWPDGQPKQFFFIDSRDILGIVENDACVGVYSGRPTVPHVQE